MKARLLVINPQQAETPPASPTLILEQQGNIVAYSAGWPYPVKTGTLDSVTQEDIYKLPGVRAEDQVYLSDIRSLPNEDLMSAEAISCARSWWIECAAEFLRQQSARRAA